MLILVEMVEESKQANSNELTIPEHSHDQTQGSIDESGAEHEQSTPSRVERTKVEPMKNVIQYISRIIVICFLALF